MSEHYFSDLNPEERRGIALKCISQACINAKNSVIASRNDVIAACSAVTQFNNNRTFFSTLAGGFWAAFAAAAVAAAVTPWPFNLVLWIIAGLLAIGAAIATGYAVDAENKYAGAQAAFSAAEQILKDAVAAVMRDCDSACYQDLSLPTCP